MKPMIWIIDEEWPDYEVEKKVIFGRCPDCELKFSPHEYGRDFDDFGHRADAVICQVYVEFPKKIIDRMTRCQAISVYGAGFDRIDVAAAKARGIKVTNVPGYCNEDLADYVMAAVYYFYKELHRLSSEIGTRPWGAQAVAAPPNRLSRSVLHILGLGRIGRMTAQKALANGLTVTAYDPFVPPETMAGMGVRKVEWAEGLREADYVAVHLILNEMTRHKIKYDDFKLMKPSAVLINAARGQVIDEAGMVRALNEGLIRGVMLDTVAAEPPSYSEPIFNCPAAHITPHVAYISVQSFEELKRRAAENAVIGLSGGDSPDLVNG